MVQLILITARLQRKYMRWRDPLEKFAMQLLIALSAFELS
jgi:hypothetical protein